MGRLLDIFETVVSPSHRLFGLVDTAVDAYGLDPDNAHWLLSAPGLVYLQVPSQVIEAVVRLESWSTPPPEKDANWFGREEVEVELPGGDLEIYTVDGGVQQVPLILPSHGLYKMRWQWMFNGERGPFISPLSWRTLEIPLGQEEELDGKDQYCLVQIWRIAAAPRPVERLRGRQDPIVVVPGSEAAPSLLVFQPG
ncbi:hypothetical protein KQY30_16370 [Streptomyces sp. GMY02]|uniref:hypothetical protein n=1 Tax=Streptomyces sp. GMY02 TaxID=1333528 RepID=UPI001C2C3159|nr:hypothetical protein [Streptomyces sp. GMY02]QXE35599.1 hypothetical protein KQY30_16370 [Streptomyces sp. GMY02]